MTADDNPPTLVDGHPKNIAVKPDMLPATFFDFGRIVKGDERYVLPNLLAHFLLAIRAETLDAKKGLSYVKAVINGYMGGDTLDLEVFVDYVLAEMLHRGLAGRWVAGELAGEDRHQLDLQLRAMKLMGRDSLSDAGIGLSSIDEVLGYLVAVGITPEQMEALKVAI